MNAYSFPTIQSCEGHEHDSGTTAPWIEIEAPEPSGWQEDTEKQARWTRENLRHRQRIIDDLAEFYSDRHSPFDAHLSIASIGAFGAFRVQSIGAETIQLLPREKQIEKAALYREEMNAFGECLRARFFSGGR